MSTLKIISDDFKLLLCNFFGDRCVEKSAALAYNSLLALVPLATVILGVLSVMPGSSEWSEQIQDYAYNNLVPAAGDTLREYMDKFVVNVGALTSVGIVFLFITSLMLLSSIENTLNDIWGVKSGRNFINRVMIYWTMLTLGPLLIGASLSITSYVTALSFVQTFEENSTGLFKLKLLPVLFQFAAFFLMYVIMPHVKVSLRYASIGAGVSTVLFFFAQKSFAYWVSGFNGYAIIYGALSAIPIFLIWLYVSWLVILVGAQVAAIPHRRGDCKIKHALLDPDD